MFRGRRSPSVIGVGGLFGLVVIALSGAAATVIKPTAFAGPDRRLAQPQTTTQLEGVVVGGTARWVQTAGPAPAVLAATDAAGTSVQLPAVGRYVFRLQVVDTTGTVRAQDDVTVTYDPPPALGQVGAWTERLLNADGSINASKYRTIAANLNSGAIVDWRMGPKYADFDHGGEGPTPKLWGPDATGRGLWPYGTQPVSNPGEPNKCVPSAELPRSDEEERLRGFNGAGWIVAGQHAFVPDANADRVFSHGLSNTRLGDGVGFNTGGLCLRMFASWTYDWWNRNNISTPATPEAVALAERRIDAPRVPVAITRGRANANQVGFAAYKDGTIIPMVVGNSAPEFYDPTGVRLPAGLVPTAMAVTPYNEFLVVTAWDTRTVTGKLVFIALRGRQMALGSPSQTPHSRWYWGLPSAWTITHMKIIGSIDLPMKAPTSVDVSNHVVLGNPRGYSVNDDPAVADFGTATARATWRAVTRLYITGDDFWRQTARAGYAVVASRAENKVSFIDMGPLYRHYRDMYLTDDHYAETVNFSATDPNIFPYAFGFGPAHARGQVPVVATTLSVPQPTAVSAGVQTTTAAGLDRSTWIFEYERRSPREDWSGVEPERILARSRAYVASMDGTVRIYNVQGLNFVGAPTAGRVPEAPIGSFRAGRNPVSFGFTNGISTAPDDLFVVSRGDRSVTFAFPDGRVQGVLRDSRLIDPVAASIGVNSAGYGGSGVGLATFAMILTIADFNGRRLTDFGVEVRRNNPTEQYPFRTPTGPARFLFGSSIPTPGRPFAINAEEII